MAALAGANGLISLTGERLCQEFLEQGQGGGRPSITDFLARASESEREALAVRLVGLDIERRVRSGERPSADDYREILGNHIERLQQQLSAELTPTSDALGSAGGKPRTPNAYVQLSPIAENQTLGRYRLKRPLGRGAFGEVWEAIDPDLHRTVAVKTPRFDVDFTAEELNRFRAEAKRAAQLKHPFIVGVHDVGVEGDRPYLVYELIDGRTLREVFNFERPELISGLKLFCEICQAIEHAHAAQIVHRDIKPGNILIDRNGRPHVADFGMAKMPSADATIVEPGAIFGTPQYMAPEQTDGTHDRINTLSDTYALGVVLYELLTGVRPFQGTSSDLMRRIREETPSPPSERAAGLPVELDAICLKAMAKEQKDRYQSVAELRSEIESFLDEREALSREPITLISPRIETHKPPFRASRRTAIGLGVAGVLLLAILLVMQRKDRVSEASANAMTVGAGTVAGQVAASSRSAEVTGTIPVEVATNPPGARIVVWGLDPYSNSIIANRRFEGARESPVSIDLPPGSYLVVAELDGRFHEVWRQVPKRLDLMSYYMPHFFSERKGDGIAWTPIMIPEETVTDGMVHVPGSPHFLLGTTPEGAKFYDLLSGYESVPAFWVDKREVTWKEMEDRLKRMPDSWNLEDERLPDDFPAMVWWEDATAHVEATGKRLMTEVEYEFVASNGGQTLFPWGTDPEQVVPWTIHSVTEAGADQTSNPPGITGLFSNAGEWTSSFPRPLSIDQGPGNPPLLTSVVPWGDARGLFVVRGLPSNSTDSWALLDAENARRATDAREWKLRGARGRTFAIFNQVRHGFRGARSDRPRLTVEDLKVMLGKPDASPKPQ